MLESRDAGEGIRFGGGDMACCERCLAKDRCEAMVCEGARLGTDGPSLDETLVWRDGAMVVVVVVAVVTLSKGPNWKWVDKCLLSGDVGRESIGEGSIDVAGELM